MTPGRDGGEPARPAAGHRQVVALMAAFAAGLIVGMSALVLAGGWLAMRTPAALVAVMPVGTDAMVRRLDRALSLDPRQETAVRAVVRRERLAGYALWKRVRPEAAELMRRAEQDIHGTLTPPQQARWFRLTGRRMAFLVALECRFTADDTVSVGREHCPPLSGGW